MTYEQIETAIVDRLATLRPAGFEVVPLPDNNAEAEKSILNGRVTVGYRASKYEPSKSTSLIAQDEQVQIELIITAKTLRGAKGVHKINEYVRARLIGFKPLGCGKITAVENVFNDFKDGFWSYSFVVSTSCMTIEQPDSAAEVLITQILIDEIRIGG